MRQRRKQIAHTPALIIYNKEPYVIRAEIQRQRQDISLQRF